MTTLEGDMHAMQSLLKPKQAGQPLITIPEAAENGIEEPPSSRLQLPWYHNPPTHPSCLVLPILAHTSPIAAHTLHYSNLLTDRACAAAEPPTRANSWHRAQQTEHPRRT
ncbi:predicted protein [Histoplasma capsulatum H143]|uniref:Uncharacterized protein n=1 Tax=Ajellomyces capsulatus (strain H143) TaxID=544712 RepID=C6HK53_AJECH|nr:predicted protein [Histoplasma capsulatum H143]